MRRRFRYILSVTCLLFSYYTALSSVNPAQSFAQTVVFEDSFDESYEKWDVSRGSSSFWNIQQGQLVGTVPTTFAIAELVPSDQHWNDEWHDFILEMNYVPVLGADKNFSFFVQDSRNWYEFHFYAFGLQLVAVQNGRSVWSRTYPEWLTYGVANKIKLEVLGDTVIFSVNEEEIVRETDPIFSTGAGKIGLKLGAGSVVPTQAIIDDVKLTIPGSEIPPPVSENNNPSEKLSHLSQWDPAWASLEYDTASKWSEEPTIGRWGCVITSLSMIFKAHGIVALPDGTALTPATLNAWLLEQPDGYVNGGYVNIAAATRITKLASDQNGTPKLEYKSHSVNHESILREQFDQNNPSIIEIPGHFLVANADASTAEVFDAAILDPAYSYTKLSQHKKDIKTVRTFTPSFTDLSYLVIAAGKDFELTDPQGAILPSTSHYLQDPLTPDAVSPAIQIIEIAKPESGDYLLSISSSSSETIQIFTYDTEANLTDLSFTTDAQYTPTTYLLTLTQDGSAEIELTTQPTLSELVQDLWNSQEITAFFAYEQLLRVAEFSDAASVEHQDRYALLLAHTTNHYAEFISDDAKEKLNRYFEH